MEKSDSIGSVCDVYDFFGSAATLSLILQTDIANNTINELLSNGRNIDSFLPFFVKPFTVIQIHVAVISINFLALVFSYENSEGMIGSFPNCLSFTEFWLTIVMSDFLISVLIYSLSLFLTTSLVLEVAITLWFIFLLVITSVATTILLDRIIRLSKLTELDLYSNEVKYLTRKLAIIGSRLKSSETLLDKYSTTISADVTRASKPEAEITAKELDIPTGEYIIDIDLSKLRFALDRDLFLNGYFKVSVGHQVSSQDEVILCIVDHMGDHDSNEIVEDISTVIKTKEYDSAFNFNYFSKEYEIIHEYIGELENKSKESIDTGNMPKLNTHIYSYQSLFHSLSLSGVGNSTEIQQRVVHPILRSLRRLFVYWVENRSSDENFQKSNQESIQYQQVYGIVDQTYMMGKKLRNGDFNEFDFIETDERTTSMAYFEKLLRYYYREADTVELATYIQSRIDELNELEQES